MDEREFSVLVKKQVAARATELEFEQVGPEDVYIVWMCKILQNNKALAATSRSDGLYFEVTYSGDREELYIDVYLKRDNAALSV